MENLVRETARDIEGIQRNTARIKQRTLWDSVNYTKSNTVLDTVRDSEKYTVENTPSDTKRDKVRETRSITYISPGSASRSLLLVGWYPEAIHTLIFVLLFGRDLGVTDGWIERDFRWRTFKFYSTTPAGYQIYCLLT